MSAQGNQISTVVDDDRVPMPAAINETASIIQVIERAALNPDVDIDKMERLLQMQERIMNRNASAQYAAALAAMQPELPLISERGTIKNRNGDAQSKYALWEDVVGDITPILSRHGFALSFRTSNDANGITVTGVLTHCAGHREETSLTLPADASGSKNSVQAIGSSTSYGQRYTARALLNLRTGQIDDDGNGGADEGESAPTAKQENCYPPERFKEIFPTWEKMILAGRQSAENIIAMVSSKGQPLSEIQRRSILAVPFGKNKQGANK